MKKLIALLAALAALAGMLFVSQPAQAVSPAPVAAQAATAYHVPNITCENSWSCVVAYYGNGANDGYAMARRYNGSIWVRLTSVHGADNQDVAQIYCVQEDSCIQGYYQGNIYLGGSYLMVRLDGGTGWYRESLVNGA